VNERCIISLFVVCSVILIITVISYFIWEETIKMKHQICKWTFYEPPNFRIR
jgi:hypothetical protein